MQQQRQFSPVIAGVSPQNRNFPTSSTGQTQYRISQISSNSNEANTTRTTVTERTAGYRVENFRSAHAFVAAIGLIVTACFSGAVNIADLVVSIISGGYEDGYEDGYLPVACIGHGMWTGIMVCLCHSHSLITCTVLDEFYSLTKLTDLNDINQCARIPFIQAQ